MVLELNILIGITWMDLNIFMSFFKRPSRHFQVGAGGAGRPAGSQVIGIRGKSGQSLENTNFSLAKLAAAPSELAGYCFWIGIMRAAQHIMSQTILSRIGGSLFIGENR